jgi:hypothetical protein
MPKRISKLRKTSLVIERKKVGRVEEILGTTTVAENEQPPAM